MNKARIQSHGSDIRPVRRGVVIFMVTLLLAGAAVASPEEIAPEIEPEPDGAFELGESGRAPGTSPARFSVDVTRPVFDVQRSGHATAGRYLVDIEVRWDGAQELYTAVWFPITGVVHTLIQGTSTEWTAFINSVTPLAGRWLDIEVGYFGGVKKYSAIYYQDGDDYNCAVHSNNSDATFQTRLHQYLREGRSIIDFEAYTEPGGETRFAGVWVADPNQPPTHLLYNLEAADISSLLRPMQGRVIDIDRYYSSLHGEERFAMILAMLPGGGWGHYRNQTWSEIETLNDSISDGNTHLIDLDPVVSKLGAVRYNAVWGNNFKSLNEVPAMPALTDPEPLTTELSSLVDEFEYTRGRGTVGLYAKNLRTNQTITYRHDEMFYLASATKIAVHIKFWEGVETGLLSENALLAYTSDAVTGSPWYVDERGWPGFATGAPTFSDDRGQPFTLDRFDHAMMGTSDNGATSALVLDDVFGVAYAPQTLNTWLASESGVGRGWGLVTAIQDVDRFVIWQGQQHFDRAGDKSYFQLPRYALGPRLRNQWRVCAPGGVLPADCLGAPDACTRCWRNLDCDGGESCEEHEDPWGELANFFGLSAGEQAPRVTWDIAHPRYYATGINAATPHALGNVWEGYVENRWLLPSTTAQAITNVTEPTPFDAAPNLPAGVDAVGKGGTREAVCTDAGFYRYGGENIVVTVLTKDLTIPCVDNSGGIDVRGDYMPWFGEYLLFALASDLEVVDPATDAAIGPSVVRPGEDLAFFANVTNHYGGDADPVNIRFVLSSNDYISTSDPVIGVGRTDEIPGNGSEMVLETATMPHLSPGMYYFGWFVDYDEELPELNESNKGFSPVQIQVQAPLVEITDLHFIADEVAQWSATADTAHYRLYEGTSSTLPLLQDGSLDSCQFDLVTSPISSDFARTPPPGEFYWYLVKAESNGPIMPSSHGPRSLDPTGECGTSCSHSKCDVGAVVNPVCDTCVAAVCDHDPYCCDTMWDSLCVEHVRTVCNSLVCLESAGTCDHTVCTAGTALVQGCDDPPVSPSCVDAICNYDSFCCTNEWDSLCVDHVDDRCGAICE